ncbi:TnsA-like heteromeric transposase endonuclease subunit [Streptomyces somaliensis DSM 40738]|nr:TnsA-like heteromeric transposase endonuclease subunit [Streptomyces somaliensis]MCQ0025079.1 TnsA-like heteromeric transposase endonuclease subunit [Streptomyces somaliensis DSM 40738]
MDAVRECQRRPLPDCVTARFEDVPAVRPFRWSRGERHFSGWYWAATTGRHVGFESWLERDRLVLMDFDPGVVGIASQPFWLHWHDAELTPLRRQHSGVAEKKGLWEVHYDPYDVSRIWVRDRLSDPARWITVFWKNLHRVGVPFGEMAWDHAREQVPGGTGEAIADAAAALLRRAHDGPAPRKGRSGKRSRRIAARTRATASDRPAPDPTTADAVQDDQADTESAKVIPLGSFDPLANPWRRP